MAGDIKIRLVSELYPEGFNQAVAGLKKVEDAYNNYKKTTDTALVEAKGSITKMVKNYKTLLNSGMADAPQMARDYFKSWSDAMIYNFTGGDSAKLKATMEKAIREIMNIGGISEDQMDLMIPQFNKQIKEMGVMYDEASTGIESASRRKQIAYEKEMVVLKQLGLDQEAYTLTMQNAKQQMMALSPSMENYRSQMEKLTMEYNQARNSLEQLNKEQTKTKGGLGSYLGTVAKGMLAHQAVASAIRAVKQTLKDATEEAGKAEQIYNKLNTVFLGVSDSASQMATSLSSSIGVAVSTASSALTTVGDLLQAQGMGVSESLETAGDWVQKFQDIINFKDINESLDEFSKNIMAGFLGNTRNLRSIGVVVKDTAVKAELAKKNLDKLTGSELELAKMNIRAEMTFKQLENAMGATEREWGTNLAVNRRLNEAWKTFKENLGTTINSVLKPMKEGWTEVLNEINKATEAQKKFNEGSLTPQVYDIHNNDKDKITFDKRMYDILNWNNGQNALSTVANIDEMDAMQKMLFGRLEEVFVEFEANVTDVSQIFGDILPKAIYDYLQALEDERNAEYGKQGRTATISSASDAFDKFQEALLAINGVDFTARSFANLAGKEKYNSSDAGMNSALGIISDMTDNIIGLAIKSIATTDLTAWGDAIKMELEGIDLPDLIEAKMKSVSELFSATWNEFWKDGTITEDEQAKLDEIKKLYAELGIELDTYNGQLERQKNITSALDSMKSTTSDYQTQFEQLGMSENVKAVDNLRRNFEETKNTLGLTGIALMKADAEYGRQVYWLTKLQKAQEENERKEKAKTAILEAQNSVLDVQKQIAQLRMTDEEKALDDLKREYTNQVKTLHLNADEAHDLWEQYNAQAQLLVRLNKLTKDYNDELEAEEKRKTTIADYKTQGADYAKQLAQFGMSDREKTRDDLRRAGDEALKAGDYELLNTIIATARSFDALQKAVDMAEEETQKLAEAEAIASGWSTLKENALGSMGTVGNAISTFTDGKGSIISDILTVLLDIFQQSKYWDELVEIVNNVIEPILPLVHTIVYTLKNLEPVFELIASILTAISLVINSILTAINLIIDFFEWGWNWLKTAFHNLGEIIAHPLNKGARDWQELPKLSEYTKETKENYMETNREILDGLDKIANNTSKDNTELLKAYTKMRDNQMITASEYDALVAGLGGAKYDRVHTYDGGTWQNTSGGNTIVYSGDMKFTIEGTNLSADEIAEAVLRKQQQWATTAQYH